VLVAIFGAVFAVQWAARHAMRMGVSMFGNISGAASAIVRANQLLAN